jgi:hypothetical protein
MNPCERHEKEDVDRHGSGFDCVYCKVEQLEAVAKAAQDVEDNVAHPTDYQEGFFMNALYNALTALEENKDG